MAASVLSVLIFNFFFTHPYFTFMSDPSYIATFGVMFVVAFLGSSLTTRMKRQARLNAEKAYRTAILLETSQKLQKAEGSQAILALTAHQLNKLLDPGPGDLPAGGKRGAEPHPLSRLSRDGLVGIFDGVRAGRGGMGV